MPAKCPIIKPPEDLDMVSKALQRSGVVNKVLRTVPQLGPLLRAINPAADMVDEDIARHVIGHAVLREERQTAAMAGLSLLVKEKNLTDLMGLDKDGFVTLARRKGSRKDVVHINDLLEGKLMSKYKLTPEQVKGLKLRRDLWDDFRFYFNRFGGNLDTADSMFPRMVEGWTDPATGKFTRGDELSMPPTRGGSPLSKGGSFTRSRAMNPDGTIKTSQEMIAMGWKYVDPDVALHAKGLEISRRTADAQFAHWLTTTPLVVKKGQILGSGAKTGVHPARWGMVGFDSSQTPALAGYYALPEHVKYINELMSTDKKSLLGPVTWLVNESRAAIASTDFGTTGVQLLATLGADAGHLIGFVAGGRSKPSNIFGTAVRKSFESFFSDSTLTRYYADNKAIIDRWAPYIGGLRNSEYVSGILKEPQKSLVTKLPLFTRFARAFESSLDVAKIEYIKSLERIMGPDISRADKEALGAWVRNSTGMTSTARLGISPRQQDIEATWLFFSPRFTRSLFAMTATLLKADKAGNEARLALGGFAAASTGIYVAAAAALGQEPDLEPLKNGRFNPDFFTLRVGENRVGIGGGMRALSRLFAESFESARTDPTRFISKEFRGTSANPILAFWRSRTAPLTGTLMDIWTGEDFKGAPIEDGNDWAQVVKSRVLPFSLQAALEAKGQADTRAGVALISGFGFNSSPVTAYQLYNEYLEEIRNADGSRRFPDGAGTVHTKENGFKDFLLHDPQAKHLKDEYERSRLGGAHPGRDIQKIIDTRRERLEAAEDLLNQTGDYRRYRNQVNQIRADSRVTMETLHLDSVRNTGDRKIVTSWYETYKDPIAVDPVTGGINSDGLEQVQDAWKAAHPGEWERLIEPSETYGETPMETELRTDRKFIADAGWWDSNQTAWDYLKEMIQARSSSPIKIAQYDTYEEYVIGKRLEYTQMMRERGRQSPEMLADILMQRDPLVAAFNKIRTRDRLLLQRNNPGLTAVLEKWGYNHVSLQEYGLSIRQSQAGGYVSP